jgi:hypothetical protein
MTGQAQDSSKRLVVLWLSMRGVAPLLMTMGTSEHDLATTGHT